MNLQGHVYFEAVWSELLNEPLMYLKKYNPLYIDVSVDIGNIPDNFSLFANDDIPGTRRIAEDLVEIEYFRCSQV